MTTVRPGFIALLIVALLLLVLSGCAALPMPLQPNTENNSNMAEGAVIVLTLADTAQTMHCKPKPGRVLVTNLALLTVHTMVSSWLDDKVEQHKADDSAGFWYVGRITFHAVSILGEGAAVASNASRGCRL